MAPVNPTADRREVLGYGLLLLLALCAYIAPMVLGDQVLFPHDNGPELGARQAPASPYKGIESDQVSFYLPELQGHLRGDHRAWIATWNPYNELGRPIIQLGFGRSFPLGFLLAKLTSDPYRYFTWWALLSVCGTALFAFGFLRSLDLRPLACVTGALGLSIGPLFPAWAEIPMVQWDFCWALASMLAVQLWLRRPGPGSWLGLAFATYAILLTGYLQHALLLGWIAAGFVLIRILATRAGWAARARALAALTSAVLCGALLTAPVYADFLLDLQRSARPDEHWIGRAQFLAWPQRSQFLASLVDVFWESTGSFRRLSLTPVFAGLCVLPLFRWKRGLAWYWLGWSVVLVLAMVSTPVQLGLGWMGLAFSNWPPVQGVYLPAAVLAALGVEHLLGDAPGRRWPEMLAVLLPMVFAGLLAPGFGAVLEGRELLVAMGLCAATVLFARWPRGWVLLPALGATLVLRSPADVPRIPREEIIADSPLAEELRQRTADGSRFAWVGQRSPGARFLESNAEQLIGARSVHSYDHVMHRAYDHWARAMSAPRRRAKYDRRFLAMSPQALHKPALLSPAGISTVLSKGRLERKRYVDRERFGELTVARDTQAGPLFGTLTEGSFRWDGVAAVQIPPEAFLAMGAVRRSAGQADWMRLDWQAAEEPQLLFLSQKHHPHWKAWADDGELQTVTVNHLFQGVLLPPGLDSLELRFEPWVRWSFLPQAAFGLAALLLASRAAGRRWARRLARPRAPAAGPDL